MNRKLLFRIHGWLGMTFGGLLFVICFSGAAAALSHEIDWLVNPAIRVSPHGVRLGWSAWMKAARQERPDWKLRWISAPLNSWFAAEVVAEAPSGQLRKLYVNPYTGVVQGGSSYFNVQRFLRDFHRLLNMGGNGLYLVSSFGFVLLFSVISGLLFYRNWWRNLFQLRLTKGPKAFWSDAHRMIGVWSFLFSIIIGVTGIWYFVEMVMLRNRIAPAPAPVKLSVQRLREHGPTPQPMDLDEVLRRSLDAMPGLDVRQVWFPVTANEPVRIDGQASAWLVRDRANQLSLDPYSGEILEKQRAEELSLFRRWEDTADPLHFGNFGGVATKILWSVLGLGAAVSVLTGGYLSIRQTQSETAVRSRWTVWSWLWLTVLASALWSSVPAMTRYRTSPVPAYVSDAEIDVGPWRVALARAQGAVRAQVLCGGCTPNFKSIAINGAPLKPRGEYWVASKVKGALAVRIEDWAGIVHTGVSPASQTGLNGQSMRPDEGPYTGTGTWVFLAPLMIVLVGVFTAWTMQFGAGPRRRA